MQLTHMMVPDFRTFVVLLRKSSSQQRPMTVYYVCVCAAFIANILQCFKEIVSIFFFFLMRKTTRNDFNWLDHIKTPFDLCQQPFTVTNAAWNRNITSLVRSRFSHFKWFVD